MDDGPLILLQPRRVAARAIARRIAEEQRWTLGHEVGWQVRFERRFSVERMTADYIEIYRSLVEVSPSRLGHRPTVPANRDGSASDALPGSDGAARVGARA